MSEQIADKKRGLQQVSGHVNVPVGDLGQNFKSKADFHNYWSTMLQWYCPPVAHLTK